MTDEEFWIAIFITINIWVNVGAMIFFHRRRLEQLENYLAGAKSVEWNRSVWGGGYIGCQMRLSNIMAIIFLPNLCHKRGYSFKDADKRIPKKPRLQLKIVYTHMAITVLGMGALYFILVGKYGS